MIINIFIPEKIDKYYLLSKRVIGFDLSKTHIYATQLLLSGHSITIEKFYQEEINSDTTTSYQDRTSQAIAKIMQQAPAHDAINTSLSSSVVLFKELQLPFTDPEKIAMVINYEVEPYLPFTITDAIVDFIITKTNTIENNASIMVAAVQKKYIAEHLTYFEKAGFSPTKVSIDLFDLYGLYNEIPFYADTKETVALIDIEFHVTRIAFILSGQLKLIRTLPKGIAHVAKHIAQSLNIPNGQAMENLIRFGFEKHDDPSYKQAVNNAFESFTKEISFTLQSFIAQTQTEQPIKRLLFLGRGSEINGIDAHFKEILAIRCELFDSNALLKMPSISLKNSTRIPRSSIMSLSTAFPSTITERLNMRQQEFALPTTAAFNIRLFTAVGLFVLFFTLLIFHSYWQQRTLNITAQTMSRAVINRLRELDLTDKRTLEEALPEAEEKVANEEELWFAFSRQRRFSFLKALQELSTAIDRKAIGLNLSKLIITTNEITLEGQVKGFEELKVLERELRESKLFSFVPTLQELKFSEKLPLKKNGRR
jgi:type IV pilus assembly protein PilM